MGDSLRPGHRCATAAAECTTPAMAGATPKFTWYAIEAYPLFVAVGAACGVCAFQVGRCFSQKTEFGVFKTTRADCIPEAWDEEKKGKKYHDHAFRRMVRPFGGAGIFKDWNEALSKPKV